MGHSVVGCKRQNGRQLDCKLYKNGVFELLTTCL
jgi:hypothetical protein